MPPQLTRADSLREYLTGALVDGGVQSNPLLSLGGYRSVIEALSLGVTIGGTPIPGVAVQYAGGGNPPGSGVLTAVDPNNLTWQPSGAASPGLPAFFPTGTTVLIVEALGQPGQYLRIQGTPPFTPGNENVILAVLADNAFGMGDLSVAQATSGLSSYSCTMVRNESGNSITAFQRWLSLLGTRQISNGGGLPASGTGSIITGGSFNDWPNSGWCRVESSGGALKEVVYYNSRTATTLTVPASGRSLLGTAATAGSGTDVVYPVPGVAIGMDPAGTLPFGVSVQTVANAQTAPAGVTWNKEVLAANGLQIGSLLANQQVALWAWRQYPPGAISAAQVLTKYLDSFNAF